MEFMKYQGEWYVWILFLILILFVIFMPKRNLTWAGIFVTLGVAGHLTWISDSIAGSVFDLFDLAKSNTTELSLGYLYILLSIGSFSVVLKTNYYEKASKSIFLN